MNWVLILTMYGLLVFGVFSIESAARHIRIGELEPELWGPWFADRQKLWIILGSIAYFGAALTDYRWLKWLGIPMYLAGIVMLVVLLAQGTEEHQLSIAGINFQPTQLVIAAGIIMIGFSFEALPRLHRAFGHPVVKLCIIALLCGVPFLLVIKNGDMGSAIVWLPVAFVAMLVGGIPFRYLILMAQIGAGIVPIIYFLILPTVSPRGAARINNYLENMKHGYIVDTAENYAEYRVTMAVGKAGWDGVGYGSTSNQSLHHRKDIPWKTAHNDYIFAVIAEEQGFKGSLLLISGFALLLIQCLFIAFYSRDFSGQLIASGVVALLFAHIFENIGMCVSLMPITGIPLPLISYSGTFVLICMFLLGMVQSIWVHRYSGGQEPLERPA
ncbi:MAG: FtsW/RodA/SpoVE family cell cycle protein [Roseibacillus sp.]|jgi:rod shape determining protein RodA